MTRKNFCAAPWSGLSLQPNGSAKICCISKNEVQFDSFKKIKSIPIFTEIRQTVINDERHKNCDVCWEQENTLNDNDWNSRRSIYQYDDFFHDLNSADRFQLEHLDLRWSNTCNLNCVYCDPYYSSRWADLLKIKQRFRINPKITDEDLFNLKVVQLAGGEPMLIKENIEFLNKLGQINPAVHIEITTNLSMSRGNTIYDLLREFKNVSVVVSFESTERKFEYIRNGAVWETFCRNFETCTQDFANVQANMVYFPLSATDINNAIIFAQKYIPSSNIYIRDQIGGHGFDMLSINSLKYINDNNLHFAESLDDILKMRLINMIQKNQTNRSDTYLPDYQRFDNLINQDHKIIFPELYL